MVVPFLVAKLRVPLRRQIKVDADDAGPVEAKADTRWIFQGIAEQVLVISAGEKAVHRWAVIVANNNLLTFGQVLDKIPTRWSGGCGRWRVGRVLCGQPAA